MTILGIFGALVFLFALATMLHRVRGAHAAILVVAALMLGVAVDACSIVVGPEGPVVRVGRG